MIYKITHITDYHYSQPVFLEPQVFRSRPRVDSSQRLLSYARTIDPQPFTLSDYLDHEGNSVAQLTFLELTDHLRLQASFEAETLRANPYDFLIDSDADRLPPEYAPEEMAHLSPYLASFASLEVTAYAQEALRESEARPIPFLAHLAKKISAEFRQEIRQEGPPHPPEKTLRDGGGSCRDLTALFMEVCRKRGIAVRFVSGYQEGAIDQETRFLHAWAEAYLPGGGWRGYDPTLGLAVADRHVAVATAALPSGAMTVVGSFRGVPGVVSSLDARIELQIVDRDSVVAA